MVVAGAGAGVGVGVGAGAAAGLSALEAAKHVPLNHALVDTTKANEQQQQRFQQQQAAAVAAAAAAQPTLACMWPACKAPVTHFCTTKCGDQCRQHEAELHAESIGFGNHVRIPIADKAAQLRKDRDEVFADAAQRVQKSLEPVKAALLAAQKALRQADAEQAGNRTEGQLARTLSLHAQVQSCLFADLSVSRSTCLLVC